MSYGREIISLVADKQDLAQFQRKTWEGTFEEYLELVRANPLVTRNAFERVYDMIISYGVDVYEESRGEKRTHYRFFDDPEDDGRDAVFGLDGPLEHFVNALKSAAQDTRSRVQLIQSLANRVAQQRRGPHHAILRVFFQDRSDQAFDIIQVGGRKTDVGTPLRAAYDPAGDTVRTRQQLRRCGDVTG